MKRAFSLLEVLVAGFLGLMALLVLTQVLIQVMRSSGKAVEMLELSQVAQSISQRISEDLQTAPAAAIALQSSQGTFSIQPLDRTTATGKPIYSSEIRIYLFDLKQGKLQRKLCPVSSLPLEHPTQFSPAQLSQHFQASTRPARYLANGLIKEFNLERLSAERSDMIKLQFSLGLHSRHYSHQEVIALRNGDL
jgi:type II secretory pathway pseudopilin PulG